MKYAIKIAFLVTFIIGNYLNAKHIIFDLGYTLIKPNHFSIVPQLGYWDCICSYASFGSECRNILNKAMIESLTLLDEKPGEYHPRDLEGNFMPQIVCDWFEGKKTSSDVAIEAKKRCDAYKKYPTPRTQRMVTNIVDWMFTPSHFGMSMSPITPAARLVRDCARAKTKDGKPAHTLYILSNMDPESFELIYHNKANQSIFKYFKPCHIYISGLLKDMKPHRSIYEYLLKNEGINANDCIFIDDQEENIKTAQECGMTAIHLKNESYKNVRKSLKALGVIKR